MTHPESIAPRNISVIENASSRKIGRGSIFKRIIDPLHASRRRQARRLLHHYRHLIAEDFRIQPAGAAPDSQKAEESSQNANRNKPPVRIDRRAIQGI